jgi:PAS domain S-box-containing protein
MFQKIRHLFEPPAFADAEKSLLANHLITITNVLLAGTGLFTLLAPILSPKLLPRMILVAPIYVMIAGMYFLIARRHLRQAGLLLITGSGIILTAAAAVSGGTETPAYSGEIIVILSAAVLLDQKSALLFAGLAIISGLAMTVGQNLGFLPLPSLELITPASFWLAQVIYFAMAIALVRMSTEKVNRALGYAKIELVERKRTEEELQKQRDFAVQVMEALGQGVAVSDNERRYEYVNSAYARMLGHSVSEVLGKTPKDFAFDEDKGIFDTAHRHRMLGETTTYETRLRRASGEMVYAFITGVPRWHDGEITGAIAVITDLTERKLAEDKIRQYSDIVTNMQIGLYVFSVDDPTDDKTLRVIAANPAALQYSEKYLDEILGKTIDVAFKTLRQKGFPQKYLEVLRTGTPVNLEDNYFAGPGGALSEAFAVKAFPLPNNCVGVLFEDVSEATKLQIEQARLYSKLEENEEQYRLLFENSPIGIAVVDQSGRILAFNDEFRAVGKYSPEDILELEKLENLYFDSVSQDEIKFMLNQQGRVNNHPVRLRRKDGTSYDTLLTLVPARFNGQASMQVLVEDITAQKITEQALFEEQNRFRAVIENSYEGIALLDAKGEVIYYSPSNEQITGYTSRERQGQAGLSNVHSDDRELIRNSLVELAQVPGQLNNSRIYRIRHKDGSWRWVEGIAKNLLSEPSVRAIVVNIRDVTEQKLGEERIRESEERFRQFWEASFEGIGITDAGIILDVNSRLAEMLGYEVVDLIGMNVIDLVSPEARELVMNRILSGALDPVEHIALRKDGSGFPVETRGRTMPYKGKPVRVAAIRDITERKRAEREIENRLAEMAAVNKISVAMRVAQTLEEMLPRLLDETLAVLGTDSGTIWLYDPRQDRLFESLARGWFREIVDTSVHPGEGITGSVFATGTAYTSAEFHSDSRVLSATRPQIPVGWGGACVPIRASEEIVGVLLVSVKLPRELAADEVRLLTTLAEIAGNAIHRTRLHEQSLSDAAELAEAYETTLEGWSHALDLRDRETEGHTLRVTEMVLRLGRMIGLSEPELVHVRRGALLHDIGKMSIPDSILHKTGALTDAEWAIMQQHPIIAKNMLSPISYLTAAIDIPYCHHEKWDGTGYPRALNGEQIPFTARMCAVVDV